MSRTYFVSGHRDITEEEFIEHYEPILWEKMNERDSKFVIGDCAGADDMAQKYLSAMQFKDVTVYHMFEEPRHNAGFKTIGGFNTDTERDSAMTDNSDEDILWIKPGRENSGTAHNKKRREKKNK